MAEAIARPSVAARLSLDFAVKRLSLPRLAVMRAVNHIQMRPSELHMIANAVQATLPCRMLVFGLGNDSSFWRHLNPAGRTVFLEDNERWYEKVLQRDPNLEAYIVAYPTRRSEWRDLLGSIDPANLTLPEAVGEGEWDVVVVDAPAGWRDSNPGRMLSIACAAKLVKPGGTVFRALIATGKWNKCTRRTIWVTPNLVTQKRRLRYYRMQQPAMAAATS